MSLARMYQTQGAVYQLQPQLAHPASETHLSIQLYQLGAYR